MNAKNPREDAALAAAAAGGDDAAFEALLERYGGRLFSFLRQRVRDTAEAEDLAQVVWIAVHRRLGDYDPSRPFTAWLFTIARNAAISAWRRNGRETREVTENDWVDRAHPAEKAFARDDAESLWRWIADHLGAEQREALWLMYREGASVREIATILQCSVIRVKVLLFRARRKLLQAHVQQPMPGVAAWTPAAGQRGTR